MHRSVFILVLLACIANQPSSAIDGAKSDIDGIRNFFGKMEGKGGMIQNPQPSNVGNANRNTLDTIRIYQSNVAD